MDQYIKTIITQAGNIATEYFDKGVASTPKDNIGDLVTEADVAVSDFLVGEIQKVYPGHHIHCEELAEDINPGARYEWVIDPIDGTRNFAMGVPFFCTIIALQKDGQTYLGAVHNPISGQLFFAEKGKGAFLNDKKIHANHVTSLDFSFGVFSRANEEGVYGDYIERFRAAHIRLVQETNAWIHNYGNVLPMCHLASGGIDFVSGNAGMDWDYLAPFLICEEAGAIVSDSDGNEWQRGRQDYIIANPDLHPKVLELFRPKK